MKSEMSARSTDYEQVSVSENPSELDLNEGEKLLGTGAAVSKQRKWPRWLRLWGLIGTAVVTALVVFGLGYMSGYDQRSMDGSASASTSLDNEAADKATAGNCTEPYFRREWRSLSDKDKKAYLDAVKCFVDSPSSMGKNGTLYDDFSWVHNLIAHSTHGKAPFLTWHRRFIWVYEKTLREKCDYEGSLPFWDWSLDWEDPPSSPIFDSKLGFGGDGDPDAPEHNVAHCVTDSPLGELHPQWYGDRFEPHCLSRFFDDDDWFGRYLSPTQMQEVMDSTSYEEFFLALEDGPHDIIPGGIRGDFTTFTAPNDPIFYLHHSQLDRVWWLWQMRDKENRVKDYGGEGDGRNVTMSDTLPLAGLDKDVTVADIMDTEAGELCYRYMYT